MTSLEQFTPRFDFWLIRRSADKSFNCIKLPCNEKSVPCSELGLMQAFTSQLKLKAGDKRVICTCMTDAFPNIVGIAIWHPKDAGMYHFDPYLAQKIAIGRLTKQMIEEGIA